MKNILLTLRKNNKLYKLLKNADSTILNLINSIEYTKRQLLLNYITLYIVQGLDIKHLADNWITIETLSHDSSSLTSSILRYGKEYGTAVFQKKSKDCAITKERLINSVGEEKAKEILFNRAGSIDSYIKRYGEVDGIIKWNEYCSKRRETYKKKRGTYAKHDLQWFKTKYGEDQGFKVWNDKRMSQAYKVSTAFYVDRYGEKLGKEMIRECKARDLSFFIKKYGEVEGNTRYNEMREKINNNLASLSRSSKWSLEILRLIKENIPNIYYYGENELICNLDEEGARILQQKVILPDLFYDGKVIEFQGDVFHGNPELFEDTDTPHPFKKQLAVRDMNNLDRAKHEFYKRKGYEVLEIWEQQWKMQPEITLKKCLDFLTPKTK